MTSPERIFLSYPRRGLRLIPIARGGTNPVWNQNGFRFYTDDGNHTAEQNENIDHTHDQDINVMLRIEVEETNGKVSNNQEWALYAQKNGAGGYTAVTLTRTDGIQIATSANFADGDADNVNRLTSSALTFDGGELDEDGTCGDGGNLDYGGNSHCEAEFCLVIDSANATGGDYWDFEVRQTDGTQLDGYTRRPRLTAAAQAITIGLTAPGMTGTPQALSAVPGAVTVPLQEIGVTGLPQALVVVAPSDQTVLLEEVGVTGVAQVLSTAQRIFPNSDLVTGTWTSESGTAVLYPSIDESSRDDADYIQSALSPSSGQSRVGLETLGGPGVLDGWYVGYTYRKNEAGAESINLKVVLMESGVELTSWMHTGIPASWQYVVQPIPTGTVDQISDLSALQLHFVADTTGSV